MRLKIFEPRYRDRTVLLAKYKLHEGEDAKIEITKGYYAGNYTIPSEVIASASVETMKTKRGGEISIVVIPIDKLVKEE